MFVNQLNATYVPLMNISGNTAVAIQPNTSTFAGDPTTNGTSFIAITSADIYVTPYNLSNINVSCPKVPFLDIITDNSTSHMYTLVQLSTPLVKHVHGLGD